MRVSLLYNARAGDGVAPRRIRTALERHGHDLVRVVERGSGFGALFEGAPDLVVAAGGDGTVSAAARGLAGRGIPLAVLPLGTANNVATCLGWRGSIEEVIGRWDSAYRQPFDLGVAHGVWGERRFVEAVGGGLIAGGMAAMQARPIDGTGRSASRLARAVERYRDAIASLKPGRWTVVVDGTPTTGEFLLVEVLNIRSIGPRLVPSADAHPSDGLLCVVMAEERHREEITCYLQARSTGREGDLSLPSQRARHVEVRGWTGMHVDDRLFDGPSVGAVSLGIEPAALEFLADRSAGLRRASSEPGAEVHRVCPVP